MHMRRFLSSRLCHLQHSKTWWLGATLSTLIPVIYSFSGGMRASIMTDATQVSPGARPVDMQIAGPYSARCRGKSHCLQSRAYRKLICMKAVHFSQAAHESMQDRQIPRHCACICARWCHHTAADKPGRLI